MISISPFNLWKITPPLYARTFSFSTPKNNWEAPTIYLSHLHTIHFLHSIFSQLISSAVSPSFPSKTHPKNSWLPYILPPRIPEESPL